MNTHERKIFVRVWKVCDQTLKDGNKLLEKYKKIGTSAMFTSMEDEKERFTSFKEEVEKDKIGNTDETSAEQAAKFFKETENK